MAVVMAVVIIIIIIITRTIFIDIMTTVSIQEFTRFIW